MKTFIKQTAAATVFSALFASSAFAMSVSQESVWESLNDSPVNTDGMLVSVNDGVVTLSGSIDDSRDRVMAEQVIRRDHGVTNVINLVTAK